MWTGARGAVRGSRDQVRGMLLKRGRYRRNMRDETARGLLTKHNPAICTDGILGTPSDNYLPIIFLFGVLHCWVMLSVSGFGGIKSDTPCASKLGAREGFWGGGLVKPVTRATSPTRN